MSKAIACSLQGSILSSDYAYQGGVNQVTLRVIRSAGDDGRCMGATITSDRPYFEAFDEAWTYTPDNPQEDHFGIFDPDGAMKYGKPADARRETAHL